MKMTVASLVLLCAGLSLSSCGREFARIPIGKEDLGFELTESFSAEAGRKVSLWVDADLEYTRPFRLEYRVKATQGGTVLLDSSAQAIDPPVRIASWRISVNGRVRERYQGSLGLSFKPAGTEPVRLSVVAIPGTNIREFRKGDLVLKR